MTSLVTEFAPLGSLDDLLAKLEERDERASTDVLLSAGMRRRMLEEVKKEAEGECCVCLQKLLTRNLLVLVPRVHRIVCLDDAAAVVGQTCLMCRVEVREVIRVFD